MQVSQAICGARLARMIASVCALGLAAGIWLGGSTPAYACGIIAEPVDSDQSTRMSQESAILSLTGGVQRIDLRLTLDSPEVHTGFIIPTPTPATVSGGSPNDFTYVAREIVPTRINTDLWWKVPPRQDPDEPKDPDAPVVNRIHLGVVQATPLESEDTEALEEWLEANEYEISAEATARLAHYIAMGWSFTAVKLTASYPLTGELAPIRIEFETESLVYPLFLTLGSGDPLDLTLNIFSDHRTTVVASDSSPVEHSVVWAKRVRDNALKSLGTYLTVVEMSFENPRESSIRDLSFAPADTDDEVGTEIVVEHYMLVLGIPIGWVILIFSIAITATVLSLTLVPYHSQYKGPPKI